MMVITVMMIIMVMRVKKRMILELKTTAIKLITPIELTIIKLIIQMIVMIIIIKIDNHQRRYCSPFITIYQTIVFPTSLSSPLLDLS